MSWKNFSWEVEDGVGILAFDRPDRLNALTFDVYADLVALTAALESSTDVRAVVVTGRGRGFCSGGDRRDIMGPLLAGDMEKTLAFTRMTCDAIRNMRRMPQPIVAAVNGVAAGAGAVIALASDLRVVSESASFHFLFTKVALTGADMGTGWMLPRVIGEGRAKEVLLFGEAIPAKQALDWGLANRVVPDAHVMETALEWARRLADGPQEAIRLTKRAIHAESATSFEAALELEASAQATLLRSTDHREFLKALDEKREPRYGG